MKFQITIATLTVAVSAAAITARETESYSVAESLTSFMTSEAFASEVASGTSEADAIVNFVEVAEAEANELVRRGDDDDDKKTDCTVSHGHKHKHKHDHKHEHEHKIHADKDDDCKDDHKKGCHSCCGHDGGKKGKHCSHRKGKGCHGH